MSSSDEDDDLLKPVKIGGIDLKLDEDEVMTPPGDIDSVEFEAESPTKVVSRKNRTAPDSGNSCRFSQDSDSSSPAPGRKRATIDEEKSLPAKKKKKSSARRKDESGDDDSENESAGSQGHSQGSSKSSQKKSSHQGGGATKAAAAAAVSNKPPKAKKLGQVRTPGPSTESLAQYEEDAGHAESVDFVWLQLKFALREAHLKDEHKTTWWPARRISAKNEEYWLDDLDLVIEELDNDGGVSLYMLFDEQNSLVAVRHEKSRPFDWAKTRKKHAEELPFHKRRWSEALITDLETAKTGHTVVKKDVRAMLKRAKHWLKRSLKYEASQKKQGAGSGSELSSSSEEEDLEEVAAAARARIQRLNETAVKEEDLEPEVLQAGDMIEYHDPRMVKDLSIHSASRRIATVLEVRPQPNKDGGTGERDDEDLTTSGYAPLVLSNSEGAALTLESEILRLKTMVPVALSETPSDTTATAAPVAPAPVASAAKSTESPAARTEPQPQLSASNSPKQPTPPPVAAAVSGKPTPIENPLERWKKEQAEKARGGRKTSEEEQANVVVVSSSEVAPPADLEVGPEAAPNNPPPPGTEVAGAAAAGAATAAVQAAPVKWQLEEASGAVWRLLRTYTLKPGRGDSSMGLESDQKKNAAAMVEAENYADSQRQAIHDRIFKDNDSNDGNDSGSGSDSSSDDDDDNNGNIGGA